MAQGVPIGDDAHALALQGTRLEMAYTLGHMGRSSSQPDKQLLTLFEKAVDLAPDVRDLYLDTVCGDDVGLRRELEELIAAYEKSGFTEEFLKISDPPMSFEMPSSRRIAHYELLEKLGEGGMGAVYKACDTRLGRTVALKFLPPQLGKNPEAKRRFVHEAKTASALDHPNICTIYEIGETDEQQVFIAMACYEGETLKDKIERGPMAIEDILNYAEQMAEGLRQAHAAGIVHRDIKPANVMVTESGRVLLLDFGIAKVADVELTKAGFMVGTVLYMSPEQARGRAVDHRTDLWSAGVVLYEMLTAQRPFQGDHEYALLYAIRRERHRPVASLRPDAPAALVRLVDKLLEKDPSNRFADADHVLNELRRMRGSRTAPLARNRRSQVERSLLAVLFVLAGILISVIVLQQRRPTREAGGPTYRQATFTGRAAAPALSPDGRSIAYVDGDSSLFVQDIAGGHPLRILQGTRIVHVEWSPDGSELLVTHFGLDSTLPRVFVVSRLGGPPRQLPGGGFARWSPDGARVATYRLSSPKISIVDRATLDTSSVTLEGSIRWLLGLDWSSAGMFAAVTSDDDGRRTRLRTVSRDGKTQHVVVEDSVNITNPRWSPDGDVLYYLRQRGETWDLMRLPVDPRIGFTRSLPSVLLTGLQTAVDLIGSSSLTISGDGRRLVYVQRTAPANLWMAEVEGRDISVRPLTSGTLTHGEPRVSPDGERLLFIRAFEVFVMPLTGGEPRQITFSRGAVFAAAWSPDGREIAYLSDGDDGVPIVRTIPVETGRVRTFETHAGATIAWAPSRLITFNKPGNRTMHLLDPETSEEMSFVDERKGWPFEPRFSPDGRYALLTWNRRDAGRGLWLVSGDSERLLRAGLFRPIGWSADSESAYFFEERKPEILRTRLDGGDVDTMAVLPTAPSAVEMTADGSRFVYLVSDARSDLWLIDGFDPAVH